MGGLEDVNQKARLGQLSPGNLQLLIGCAAWSPGQLHGEIQAGCWHVLAASSNMLHECVFGEWCINDSFVVHSCLFKAHRCLLAIMLMCPVFIDCKKSATDSCCSFLLLPEFPCCNVSCPTRRHQTAGKQPGCLCRMCHTGKLITHFVSSRSLLSTTCPCKYCLTYFNLASKACCLLQVSRGLTQLIIGTTCGTNS